MDLAGYWATLVAIMVGLGLADLLKNFYGLLHERQRVAWDPLPILWAVVVLLWLFNYWWGVAANLDGAREVHVAIEFVLRAAAPILLFLMAASVLPGKLPAEGAIDMRAEWAKTRTAFFVLFALNQAVTWGMFILVRGAVVWDMAAILRTAALMLVLAAVWIRWRGYQWCAAILLLAGAVARMAMQPVQ